MLFIILNKKNLYLFLNFFQLIKAINNRIKIIKTLKMKKKQNSKFKKLKERNLRKKTFEN